MPPSFSFPALQSPTSEAVLGGPAGPTFLTRRRHARPMEPTPPEPPSLDGRTAAVTGASSGIGEAVAERLAAEGMRVALGARRKERLDAVAKRIEADGGEALPVALDVRDEASVAGFADAVGEAFGEVDLLMANAGRGGPGAVRDLDVDTWRDVLETNLTGAFLTVRAFLPLMERDGMPGDGEAWRTIVTTASVSGTMGMAGSSAYCASKWGLRGFTQSLALEVADSGIRVASVNPGYVATDWHEGHPREGDMVQPGDIAHLVVTLATMPATVMLDDVTVWPARMYTE